MKTQPSRKTALLVFINVSFCAALLIFYGRQSSHSEIPATITPWPPALGQSYPDLELIDQKGKAFKISDFKEKTIIVEPIGMNCPACQAFSGAHDLGAFEGNAIQNGLPSMKKLLPRYAAGIKLPHKDIVFIQLLLYDMKMNAPTAEDAAKWAEHFNFRINENEIVAISPHDLRGHASYNLIPGFQLIDKKMILRSDSTGHRPKDSLYETLLPMIPNLL